MTEATTTELLANFTCGSCGAYSINEPITIDVEPYEGLNGVRANCPKCGELNELEWKAPTPI